MYKLCNFKNSKTVWFCYITQTFVLHPDNELYYVYAYIGIYVGKSTCLSAYKLYTNIRVNFSFNHATLSSFVYDIQGNYFFYKHDLKYNNYQKLGDFQNNENPRTNPKQFFSNEQFLKRNIF